MAAEITTARRTIDALYSIRCKGEADMCAVLLNKSDGANPKDAGVGSDSEGPFWERRRR